MEIELARLLLLPTTEEQRLEVTTENPILITEGYSRDHRPDLKQCVLDLIVSSDGDIPILIRGGSGNESDIGGCWLIFLCGWSQTIANLLLRSSARMERFDKFNWRSINLRQLTTPRQLIQSF